MCIPFSSCLSSAHFVYLLPEQGGRPRWRATSSSSEQRKSSAGLSRRRSRSGAPPAMQIMRLGSSLFLPWTEQVCG
eukprot:2850770-Pleurochrysis_carterae.AAC.2